MCQNLSIRTRKKIVVTQRWRARELELLIDKESEREKKRKKQRETERNRESERERNRERNRERGRGARGKLTSKCERERTDINLSADEWNIAEPSVSVDRV